MPNIILYYLLEKMPYEVDDEIVGSKTLEVSSSMLNSLSVVGVVFGVVAPDDKLSPSTSSSTAFNKWPPLAAVVRLDGTCRRLDSVLPLLIRLLVELPALKLPLITLE